jgi:hypothetical protein
MTPPIPSISCLSYPGLSAGLGVRRPSSDDAPDDGLPRLPRLVAPPPRAHGERDEVVVLLLLLLLLAMLCGVPEECW